MMHPKPVAKYLSAILLLMCLTLVCAQSPEIVRDFDKTVDFSKFRTYKWIPKSALLRGKTPEDSVSDEALDEVLKSAIDQELQSRGLRPATGDKADLLVNYLGLVSYHIVDMKQARAANRSDEWIPYKELRPFYEGSEEGYMERYGTLSIDLVQAETNRLVWRGTAKTALSQPLQAGDTEGLEKAKAGLTQIVAEVLNEYPPRQ